ncbi:toll-like receptor 2 type-2 [Mizuhopecten yessoensis]|uniref:Toll-like receptor 2 type-2 n=1 Tax=Mizuhopecten yessoensis TaxID=6573 RepID=A0A210QLD4_MIZYE|nr:toll-like receptor 2 type-2 [Mizuhopecten yessoensis]OWF49550.1 Toll-like receptor 2 type-2 [Mizuhopecten yessoensis]
MDPTIFESLTQLKTLKINRNDFHIKKIYPECALSTISQLDWLFMDIFERFSFGNGFLNFTNLRKLELSFRGRDSVSFLNTSFHGLKRSNISHLIIRSRIRKIETNFLSPLNTLKTFKFQSLGSAMSVHDPLQGLYGLRNRYMDSLTIESFGVKFSRGFNLVKRDFLYLRSICVKNLYLTRNDITGISTDAVAAWTSRKCIEVLDVSRNRFYTPKLLYILVLFPSITQLYCSHINDNSRRKRNILAVMEQVLFLPKHLTYVNMTHNRLSGPMINVTFAKGNNLQKLDIGYSSRNPACSYGQIKGLVHLTALDMSGIDCSNPNPNMFAGMPNLSRIVASRCNLEKVFTTNSISLFKGLSTLSFVDISSNSLEFLNTDLFVDQKDSLKTLVLAGNHIDHIPFLLLKDLNVIETVDLRYNQISTLNHSEYTVLEELKLKFENFKIMLFGNPLVCSCDNLDFILWIATTKALYNKNELSCMTSTGSQLKIVKFLESFDEFQDSCVSQFWLIISIILILVFFMLIVLTREAWRRSVWLRVRCRQPLEQTIYQNDIFISYCDEDADWIVNTFVPWLHEKKIKYCIDQKHFPPGRDIADNIMDAVDNSYQTVFVVSYPFLESEWTTFTIKLASVYSFRDGREDMNIIILLNDIKKSEFPKLVPENWDVVRPLHWTSDSCTDNETTNKLFWKRLFKRIQRRNRRFLSAYGSESFL